MLPPAACFRVAHTLCDSDVPVEFVRYEHAELIVHSLRAMEEHRHLTTSWNALLCTLEGDTTLVGKGQSKLVAVKQRVALRMFICSADIEGRTVSDANPLADCMDPFMVAARRSAVEEFEVAGTSTGGAKKSRVDESSMDVLNEVLLEKLPVLLSNFKGEATILRSLTSLPQYLSTYALSVDSCQADTLQSHFLTSVSSVKGAHHFSNSNRKAAFLLLIRRISEIFLDSADDEVLANCAAVLSAMAELKHTRTEDVIVVLKETATKLRDRALELLKEKANRQTRSDSPGANVSLDHLQFSLGTCLRRLGALSTRFDLISALSNSKSSGLGKLCDLIGEVLTVDLKARTAGKDGNLPLTWTECDPELHRVVGDTVEQGLRFLLKVVAFRLKGTIDKGSVHADVDLNSHEVLVMRHRLLKLLSLCFDVQGGDESAQGDDFELQFTQEFTVFSYGLQCVALEVLSDMRSLFPAAWTDSPSPLLRACAMDYNEHGSFPHILLGGAMRFLSRNGEQVRCPGALRAAVLPLLSHLACKAPRERESNGGSRKGCQRLVGCSRPRLFDELGQRQSTRVRLFAFSPFRQRSASTRCSVARLSRNEEGTGCLCD